MLVGCLSGDKWGFGMNESKQINSRQRGARDDSLPNDHILPGNVFSLAQTDLAIHPSRVQRCRYPQNDIVGIQFRIKIRT